MENVRTPCNRKSYDNKYKFSVILVCVSDGHYLLTELLGTFRAYLAQSSFLKTQTRHISISSACFSGHCFSNKSNNYFLLLIQNCSSWYNSLNVGH